MSDRPTPETDAFRNSQFTDRVDEMEKLYDFSEKLERERDEAREAAAKWESSSDAMERAGAEQARRADENREWALRAERERDEARAGRQAYKQLAVKHAQERDEAREEIKELIYIAERAIALAEIDFENDKFGVVSELRSDLEKIKEEIK